MFVTGCDTARTCHRIHHSGESMAAFQRKNPADAWQKCVASELTKRYVFWSRTEPYRLYLWVYRHTGPVETTPFHRWIDSAEGKVHSRNLLDFEAPAIAKDAREARALFLLLRRRTILELPEAKERRGDQGGWKETICHGRVSTRGGHLRWNRARWFHMISFKFKCRGGVQVIWMSCLCLVFKDVLMVFPELNQCGPAGSCTAPSHFSGSNVFPRSRNIRKGKQRCQAMMIRSRTIRNVSACNKSRPWRSEHPNRWQYFSRFDTWNRATTRHVWHYDLSYLVGGQLTTLLMRDGTSIKEVDFGSFCICSFLSSFCGAANIQRMAIAMWKIGCWNQDVAVKALGNMKLRAARRREYGRNASQHERNPINGTLDIWVPDTTEVWCTLFAEEIAIHLLSHCKSCLSLCHGIFAEFRVQNYLPPVPKCNLGHLLEAQGLKRSPRYKCIGGPMLSDSKNWCSEDGRSE